MIQITKVENLNMTKRIPVICFLILFLGNLTSFIYADNKKAKQQKTTNIDFVKLSNDDRRLLDYYFYEGVNSKSMADYAAAYDYLSYCARLDSTNANVLFELGNFYKSMRNVDEANYLYAKAVKYDPQNYYYNMSLAGSFIEKQQYEDAAAIYQKQVDLNPSKIELYMFLSEAYRLNGDFEKSIEALNNLERTMGMNENITMQKFKLYAALNDKKKAYSEVQKYIDKNPQEVRYYALLANLYIQDNKMKEAYDILKKGKAIDPDNGYLISTLSSYYQLTNNTDAAEKELRLALHSDKTDVETKIDILSLYIGTLQQKGQDLKQANPILDSLMIAYPRESKFNLLYGNLMMLENNKKDANFQYRIYAESNPTDPVGWEQLLQSTDIDSIDAMIDVCQSAINYLPDQALFYLYLSVGQSQKKEYDKALKTVREGTERVDPQNTSLLSEFYSQAGNLFYEMNERDSAFVEYQKALQYNSKNLGVLNNFSYYLSLEGKDLDKAEKMSSITVKAEPTNPTYLDTYGWILFEQGAYATAKIYLESAVKYSEESKDISSEVLEHYGDVLYKTDETAKALEYWIKAKEKGSKSSTLDKKIETKTYIPNKVNK